MKLQFTFLLFFCINTAFGQNETITRHRNLVEVTDPLIVQMDTIQIFEEDTGYVYAVLNGKQFIQKLEKNQLMEISQIKLVINVDTMYRIRDSVQIMTVVFYPSFVRHGRYLEYSQLGQITAKGKYYFNLKYGKWKYFENNELVKKERYKKRKVKSIFKE